MTASRPLAIVALALAALLPATSRAQLRSLPTDAGAGAVRQLKEMTAVVDRRVLRLAPGAQIRDTENRIVLPGAVPDGTPVFYVLDGDGQVRQAWIPSQTELAARRGAAPSGSAH